MEYDAVLLIQNIIEAKLLFLTFKKKLMIFFHFYLFADFSFGIKYINSIALVVIFLSEREREEK